MKFKILLGVLLSSALIASPVYAENDNYYKRLKLQKERSKNIKRKRISLKDIFNWKKRKKVVIKEEVKVYAPPPKVKRTQYHTYEVVGRSAIKLAPAKIIVATAQRNGDQEPIATPDEDKVTISHLSRDLALADDLKLSAETHLAKAISQYYEDNNEFLWINEDGGWNARARSVLHVLGDASKYGLNNQDYKVDFIVDNEALQTAKEKATARVKNEIMLTTAALRYGMDASFGVVNPNKISGYHDFPVHYAKANDLLDDIAQHKLPANVLMNLHPRSEKFLALKQELANLVGVKSDVIELNTDVLIRPDDINAELPAIVNAIEKRGSPELVAQFSDVFSSPRGTQYDARLVELVMAYQKEAKLSADGIIGRGTASKLAGISSSNKVDKVKLAMERMRWLPDEFGTKHVFINQPEYRARYIVGGKEQISMRVVVGKKSNQTNFFYDEIEHVEYNPYWNVPRSIIINEFLPKSLGNPSYLDAAGYEVHSGGGRISSAAIDWRSVGSYPNFTVRQPPSTRNALGELKIMFPNKHAIYMHDTPSKSLFKKRVRAFSHGCIRLHDPRGMAAILLGKDKNYVRRQVAQGENLTEPLPSKVPVYVSYFTAWPQEDGSMGYFNDMYARDAYLNKALAATHKARSIDIAS